MVVGVKRLSVIAVPTMLLGLVLSGCGGDSSSTAAPEAPSSTSSSSTSRSDTPSDGTTDDQDQKITAFCNVILGIVQQAPQGTNDADALKLLKSVAAQFEQIGAPDDMPEAAQRALQVAITKIKALPDDATADEVSKAAADLTADEKKDQQVLGTYVQEKCMPALQPSGSPSSSN
jgi:hypothetical protein